MAELREWNITEMLEAALEKGLNWYKKNWEKRKPAEAGEEHRPEVPQQNYTEKDKKELNELANKLFKKRSKPNPENELTEEEQDALVEELFK